MFGNIIGLLLFCVLAGLINGSYAIPTKVMKNWKEENIWFSFGLFAFFIFPIINLFYLQPDILNILPKLPMNALIVAAIGGIMYGIGQICMAYTFRMIGLGLSFVIVISICTGGGALIPITWNMDKIFSIYFMLQTIGVLIFLTAVIFSYKAGKEREKNQENQNNSKGDLEFGNRKLFILGICLSIIGGIGSAGEGAAFTFSNSVISEVASKHNIAPLASNLVSWCVLFFVSGIFYVTYWGIRITQKASWGEFTAKKSKKYFLYVIYMGACYWFSITFFCKATLSLGGKLAPTVAWPIFMIAIVSTSNFWGFIFGEWKNSGEKAKKFLLLCLLLFVVAVIIFSLSSYFSLN